MYHTFNCSAEAGRGHYYMMARTATEEEARAAISSLKLDPPINECRLVSQYDDEEFGALDISPGMHDSLDRTGVACRYFPTKK